MNEDRITKQLKTKIEQLEALIQVSRIVVSTLDLDKVVSDVGYHIEQLKSGVDLGVLLYDQKQEELLGYPKWHFSKEIEPQLPTTLRLKLGQGVAGRAAQERKPIYEKDVTGLEPPRYFRMNPNTKSDLALPLLCVRELVGVLNLESPNFDAFKDDIPVFQSLADILAISLRNAQILATLQKAKEAEKANEQWVTLGLTAEAIVHRLGNNLGSMRANAVVLKKTPLLDTEDKKLLDDIVNMANYTLGFITRLQKPFMTYKEAKLSVSEVVQDAIEACALPPTITVDCKIPPDLPKIYADEYLPEVFVELLTNAVKTMRRGGSIQTWGVINGEYVDIYVKNSGRPIPKKDRLKVFELFSALYSGAKKKSIGFGLWSVQTYLRRINGYVHLKQSTKKDGTTFVVGLPRAE